MIKKREDVGIKHLNNPNAFIECSNTMDDVYENINNYNQIRKRKKLIVFDDMIVDIMGNKKSQAVIKELLIRCEKLNILLIFITQSYFSVPKDARLNTTHCFFMKKTKQKRITKYCNWSFCRHWLQRFCKNLQKMHERTIQFFDNRHYVTSKWSFKI